MTQMTRTLQNMLLPVALALWLPAAGAAWDHSQECKGPPKDSKKDEAKKAKRTPVTIIVKVSDGGTALAEAEVEVTNEHEYDWTLHTNADGVARFTEVPRGNIAIVVTKKGWKNSRHDRESKDLEAAGSEITVPITLTKQ
jgi:hypothetical protein